MVDLQITYTPPVTPVRLSNIYKTIPPIPKRFVVMGFRPPGDGDYVLTTDGGYYLWRETYPLDTPVIVLRKCKTYTFRFTGRHDCPNNEWVANIAEDSVRSFYRITSNRTQDIYEMVEE